MEEVLTFSQIHVTRCVGFVAEGRSPPHQCGELCAGHGALARVLRSQHHRRREGESGT